MLNQQFNEKLKALSQGSTGEYLISCLDEVINYIADVRNGSYDMDSRLVSIEAIKEVLYNKVKVYKSKSNTQELDSDNMI